MDVNRRWPVFAADAEVDAFGTRRLVAAHNATIARAERAEARVAELEGRLDILEARLAEYTEDRTP